MRVRSPLIPSLRFEEKTNAWISRVGFNCSLVAWVSGVPPKLGTHPYSARSWHHHAGLPLPKGQPKNRLRRLSAQTGKFYLSGCASAEELIRQLRVAIYFTLVGVSCEKVDDRFSGRKNLP